MAEKRWGYLLTIEADTEAEADFVAEAIEAHAKQFAGGIAITKAKLVAAGVSLMDLSDRGSDRVVRHQNVQQRGDDGRGDHAPVDSPGGAAGNGGGDGSESKP